MNLEVYHSFDSGAHKMFSRKMEIEKSFVQLSGIMDGIISDGVVNDKEMGLVRQWLHDFEAYNVYPPFDSVVKTIQSALADNVLTIDEAEDIAFVTRQFAKRCGYFDVVTSAVQRLHGIMSGIAADEQINKKEVQYMDRWIEEHSYLQSSWPYDELVSILTSVLSDGIVTEQEKKIIIDFCRAVAGDNTQQNTAELTEILKMGYCQVEPKIQIPEHTFCLTGISGRYTRTEIGEKIELYGGFLNSNVSGKVNYLVICDEKNKCWAFNCYGRKVEQAVKLRRKGVPIIIVNEFDLYDALEDLR